MLPRHGGRAVNSERQPKGEIGSDFGRADINSQTEPPA